MGSSSEDRIPFEFVAQASTDSVSEAEGGQYGRALQSSMSLRGVGNYPVRTRPVTFVTPCQCHTGGGRRLQGPGSSKHASHSYRIMRFQVI